MFKEVKELKKHSKIKTEKMERGVYPFIITNKKGVLNDT